mmetsp:Transcript_31871/g.107339  ORF Transcript_31871/g.107339 Transcript_31871/m.107339 type:complete len:185 (+) Transcript_31871:30-584(+)|eukprot:CAMPEP_0184257232 /NCGR_PEP_ID=MMETSP0977-20130417/9260_1 /TAXON_ID=483370 /ORGANISM="non described non described, Strain CCMP2097" /LENGTH=184 /DNA_ID=CAMNT_0026562837 /DNA_START=40 /DNA_END=594 /DNA_ORIENTATION=+
MMLRVALVLAACAPAFGIKQRLTKDLLRKDAREVDKYGQKKQVAEQSYHRDWFFDQQFEGNTGWFAPRWKRNGRVRVRLEKSRIVRFFGAGKRRGIWNHKQDVSSTQVPYLEVEVPLNKADDHYLLYNIPVKAGIYISNAIRFYDGDIYEVNGFLPTDQNLKKVGTFRVYPAVQRPVVDRQLKC